MLRIFFTGDDLSRIRLAAGADAMWEILLSLHRLRRPEGTAVFAGWKRQVRPSVPASARLLTDLAPATGYAADFLTPTTGTGALASGIEALRSTSRSRLRTDLTELSTRHPGRPVPAWIGRLAAGRLDTLDQLAHAVTSYFDRCMAPYWDALQAQIDRDRAQRRKALAEGGWPKVLETLHPSAQWSFPVLHLDYPADHDIVLDGRGLVLQPSFFCWGPPVALLDPSLTPVLAYPIAHLLDWTGLVSSAGRSRECALTALLGRTRANVLEAVAMGACSTTQLAARVAIPLQTASRHTTVLRDAGLITTQRLGKRVNHAVTPLGLLLLEGN